MSAAQILGTPTRVNALNKKYLYNQSVEIIDFTSILMRLPCAVIGLPRI